MRKPLFETKVELDIDDRYSTSVKVPHYLPSKVKPNLYELVDKTKYTELVREINTADIPDDVKEFLKVAATRHYVFNYSKIADYYSHASKDIQKLMEKSALVIIDFDDAIANGYVKLSETIQTIMKESGIVH